MYPLLVVPVSMTIHPKRRLVAGTAAIMLGLVVVLGFGALSLGLFFPASYLGFLLVAELVSSDLTLGWGRRRLKRLLSATTALFLVYVATRIAAILGG